MKPQEEELIRGQAIKALEKVTWSAAKTQMFVFDKEAGALSHFKVKKEEKLGKAADKSTDLWQRDGVGRGDMNS